MCKSVLLFVSALVCSALIGCAPTQKTVSFTTTPSGATLFIDGQEKGTSPYQTTLDFSSKKSYDVVAKLADYEDAKDTVTLDPVTRVDYPLALSKKERVIVRVVQIEPTQTDKGLELKPVEKESVAYLETIERSAFVPSVTQMTYNADNAELVGIPVMSPVSDAFFVYATSVTKGKPEDTSSNLWRQNVASASKTRMTSGQWRDLDPAFSSDGMFLIFSSNRSGLHNTLWRLKSEGAGGITKITNSESADFAPAVSSKSDVIVFSSLPPSANAAQIWTVQRDGTLPTQIREGESPQISPDGKKILFVRAASEVNKARGKRLRQLWVMNDDGSGETLLTEDVNGDIKDARWSPDGMWIMFACDEGRDSTGANNYDIWLMGADGSERKQLTTNGSWDDGPCMDSSQQFIYFRSNRGGHFNIWRFPTTFLGVKKLGVGSVTPGIDASKMPSPAPAPTATPANPTPAPTPAPTGTQAVPTPTPAPTATQAAARIAPTPAPTPDVKPQDGALQLTPSVTPGN